MPVTKKKKKEEIPSVQCTRCGKVMVANTFNFYKSYSELYRGTYENRMTICKECVKELYSVLLQQYGLNNKAMYELCRMLDYYYNNMVFESSMKQADATKGGNYVGTYFQKICGFPQYKHLTFKDSDKMEEKIVNDKLEKFEVEKGKKQVPKRRSVSNELVLKWGNLPDIDIAFLEESYNRWISKQKCETRADEVLFQEICQMELDIRKTREKGEDTVKKVEALQKLMSSANVRPLDQSTANNNADSGLLLWGTTVDIVEQNEPCEYFNEYKRKEYKDYMGYRTYFKNWVERPLKNLLLSSKDYKILDDNMKADKSDDK